MSAHSFTSLQNMSKLLGTGIHSQRDFLSYIYRLRISFNYMTGDELHQSLKQNEAYFSDFLFNMCILFCQCN